MATLYLKELFVVVFEYHGRRKPQVFGPFSTHAEATDWLTFQPDQALCKRLRYIRPHSAPNQFASATVIPVKDWQTT